VHGNLDYGLHIWEGDIGFKCSLTNVSDLPHVSKGDDGRPFLLRCCVFRECPINISILDQLQLTATVAESEENNLYKTYFPDVIKNSPVFGSLMGKNLG